MLNTMLRKQRSLKKSPVLFSFSSEDLPITINCARLHLRRKGQSLFFTITDLNNQVVASLSLGQVTISRSRKVKNSLANIDRLILKMRAIFLRYSITAVSLLFRSTFSWQIRNLERLLKLYGVQILAWEDRQRVSHGFLRAPKKPRK